MAEPPKEHLGHGITRGADLPVALDQEPLVSEAPHKWGVAGLVLIAGLVVAVVLFKYAIDVLFIVLVLGCVAYLLHRLIKWLAETELLTPAWAIIFILLVLAVGWYTWPRLSGVSALDVVDRSLHFERILPGPAVRFLGWAEQHGWAQRLLVPRDSSLSEETNPGGDAGVSIAVTSSQSTLRMGQPVTFTATLRFTEAPAAGVSKTVKFWDGSAGLGVAQFRLSGDTGVASLTTTALAVGSHSITATYARALLIGGASSLPRVVTVTP